MNLKAATPVLWLACMMFLRAQETQAFYNPSTGRWLNRDPLNETGFRESNQGNPHLKFIEDLTLYHFVYNTPIDAADYLGTECLRPCEMAKLMGLDKLDKNGNFDPKKKGDAGGVICCGGTKYSCVWSSRGATGDAKTPKAQQILSACVRTHEDNHHRDIKCGLSCSMTPTRPLTQVLIDVDQSECESYTIQMTCLEKAFRSNACGADNQCWKELDAEMKEILARQRLLNCK